MPLLEWSKWFLHLEPVWVGVLKITHAISVLSVLCLQDFFSLKWNVWCLWEVVWLHRSLGLTGNFRYLLKKANVQWNLEMVNIEHRLNCWKTLVFRYSGDKYASNILVIVLKEFLGSESIWILFFLTCAKTYLGLPSWWCFLLKNSNYWNAFLLSSFYSVQNTLHYTSQELN